MKSMESHSIVELISSMILLISMHKFSFASIYNFGHMHHSLHKKNQRLRSSLGFLEIDPENGKEVLEVGDSPTSRLARTCAYSSVQRHQAEAMRSEHTAL